ncbi:hypothetical protein AB6809_29555 [Paraburkholderia sp. RCC_158]|uniref:hypothetical protein n=1 Tax=Paraburkholderia sp. RCC_158 TaxID=3239220 RepID=UPI003525A146
MNANIEEAYAAEAERIAAQLDGIASPQYPDENLPSRFRIDLPKAGVNDAALYLHFSPYSAKGRIVVGCLYPAVKALRHTVNVPGNFLDASALESLGYVPKITVALDSTAEQVAASVKRRLLQGYLRALAAVHQGNADTIDRQSQRTVRIQRLADAAGVTLSEQSLASERFSRWHQPTSRSLEVDCSGGSVSISLKYVTPEIAEKVIAVYVDSLPK